MWVPDACTLPTGDRPVRLAEFDDLFRTALRGQWRRSATTLRWRLDPAAEAMARDLTARESRCCSFFTFTFTGALHLEVTVPPSRTAVLDALAARAGAGMRR